MTWDFSLQTSYQPCKLPKFVASMLSVSLVLNMIMGCQEGVDPLPPLACWFHPCLQLTILCHCLILCSGNVSSRQSYTTIDPAGMPPTTPASQQAPSHRLYNHPLSTSQSQCQSACFCIDILLALHFWELSVNHFSFVSNNFSWW